MIGPNMLDPRYVQMATSERPAFSFGKWRYCRIANIVGDSSTGTSAAVGGEWYAKPAKAAGNPTVKSSWVGRDIVSMFEQIQDTFATDEQWKVYALPVSREW